MQSAEAHWLLCLTLAGLLVGLSGCAGDSLPPRARVNGRVLLDGRPLSSGTIMFVPDAERGTKGPPAMGFLDTDGRYQLSTDRERRGDGAVIGFHRIWIEARDGAEPGAVSKSLVPPAYGNAETSGLIREVKAGVTNTIDLFLSTQRAAGD